MIERDVDSLTPSRDFSRRDFVRTSVGSGFAAAVLPVVAQTTIKTDSNGLVAGEVTIPVGDFKMPAYRAAPAGKANAPVVLVVSEIFGVHEYIADVARRFAKAGYFAIAPELFVRQGDASSYGEIAKLIAEVISKVPDAQVMGDLDATRGLGQGAGRRHRQAGGHRLLLGRPHHLAVCRAQPRGEGRRGLVRAAGRCQQRADAGAIRSTWRPSSTAPVLGLYGGADTGIPLDTVEKMKAALAGGSAAAKKSEFVVYPEAPHAFHADYRPELPQGGGRRRLEALPGLVQGQRRGLTALPQ